jgi:predicted metal-dependent hydrolase
LGIESDVHLVQYPDRLMTGFATSSRVGLTKPVMKLYKTEMESVLYYMLAHEMVHLKFQDNKHPLLLWDVLGRIGFNRYRALMLLLEMRANVLGNAIIGLTDREIEQSQEHLQKYNNDLKGKKSYKVGYADRDRIAYFSKKYKEFNNCLMEEVLNDFCEVMKIRDKSFSQKMIETFKGKCYPKAV